MQNYYTVSIGPWTNINTQTNQIISASQTDKQIVPLKRRFRIYSNEEKKNSNERIQRLEKSLEKQYTDKDKIALLKEKLANLESSYQVNKDIIEEHKQKFASQEAQQEELQNKVKSKKRKLNKAEEIIKTKESSYNDAQESITHLKISLSKMQMEWQQEVNLQKAEISSLQENLVKEQTLHKQTQVLYTEIFKSLEKKENANTKLRKAKKTMNQKLGILKQESDKREKLIVHLNDTLAKQQLHLKKIKEAMSQLKTITQPTNETNDFEQFYN